MLLLNERLWPSPAVQAFRGNMAAYDPLQPFKICLNQMTHLQRLVLMLALIWGNAANASDPAPIWGADWQAYVTNTYCELRREYYIPYKNDPDRRGFLSGTVFDKAFVRFVANTRLHGDTIPKESLGVIRFHLYVYPEDFPIAETEKILEANLGGFIAEAKVVSNAEIHTFSLEEKESARLLQRFIDNEAVGFGLKFANGEERKFKIYASGNRTFYVWAEMFNACIRENTAEKLKYF